MKPPGVRRLPEEKSPEYWKPPNPDYCQQGQQLNELNQRLDFPSSTSEDSGQATKPKINFVSIVASITNLQISFTYLYLKYYGRLILRLNQTGTTIAQILYYKSKFLHPSVVPQFDSSLL